MAISGSSSKSPGVAIALAAILGFIGFMGIGQMYCGAVGRGIVILLLGWALYFGFIILAVLGAILAIIGIGFLIWALDILLIIAVIVLYIWQILDANKLAKAS